MPTTKHPEPDPRPFGDPQPGQSEPNPQPIGDPERDRPGPDSAYKVDSTSREVLASKKVDDISKHESKHDTDPKRDPKRNPREKAPDGTKPEAHQPPGGESRPGKTQK